MFYTSFLLLVQMMMMMSVVMCVRELYPMILGQGQKETSLRMCLKNVQKLAKMIPQKTSMFVVR